ncbi:MAG TPA: hypothetical protein VIM61_04285 [Chthoniobacterales bacterium]
MIVRAFSFAFLVLVASSLAQTSAPVADFKSEALAKSVSIPSNTEKKWSFAIEPYGWTPGLNGDVGLYGIAPVHLDIDTISVLRMLKWAVFAKAEVRYGRWGLLSDGFFVDLQTDKGTPGPLYTNATVGVEQGLAQLALAYRLWEDRRGFVELYAGARYNYLGLNVALARDSAGIAQVGEKSTDLIFERLGDRVRTAVEPRAAQLAGQVSAGVAQARTAVSAQLVALDQQIRTAIRNGSQAQIAQLQARQTELTANLQQQVAAGAARLDGLRDLAVTAIGQELGSRLVAKWADVPRAARKLLKDRALERIMSPDRGEFVRLVQAEAEQRIAVAKVQVEQRLRRQLVDTARQRLAAAEQVLAETLRSKAENVRRQRENARQLVATSRSQLAAARRQLGAISLDTSRLGGKVAEAKKQLAKAISDSLEENLPTGGGGDRWWVDPIVGVRAQVNITRWLYLATQCDVGGFGAGSEIAWNLNGTAGINWTRSFFTEAGWRYYYLDYESSGVVYQMAESGLFVGAGLKF